MLSFPIQIFLIDCIGNRGVDSPFIYSKLCLKILAIQDSGFVRDRLVMLMFLPRFCDVPKIMNKITELNFQKIFFFTRIGFTENGLTLIRVRFILMENCNLILIKFNLINKWYFIYQTFDPDSNSFHVESNNPCICYH